MSSFWHCIYGPRLYRMHRSATGQAHDYQPGDLETYADGVVKLVRFCHAFSYWTSPVLLTFLYRRGTLTSVEGISWLLKVAGFMAVTYYTALFLRGIGRYNNQEYVTFLTVLGTAQKNWTPANWLLLSSYDFEFFAWPVDYRYQPSLDTKKVYDDSSPAVTSRGVMSRLKAVPCQMLSYLAIHTFGKRMVYPGATSMKYLLVTPLNQGRAKLVEEKRGRRAKLVTADKNEIDTMFVDRRNSQTYPNGNTLVISCEGNAGFYEIGCMVTPLEAGYSVLGWNHPGFSGSTGFPFPDQERNAVDVVLQYATKKLGFRPEEIVIFAWSIGGYSATYAAQSHPDIKHVVLDATFDDVTPLALKSMPKSWSGLVKSTIKQYMNLNNAQQLIRYPGPVLLIRRTKDEIITTAEPGVVSGNRANELLIKVLQYRYPVLIDEKTLEPLKDYLAADKIGQAVILSQYSVEDDLCTSILKSYVTENSFSFPMRIGEDMADTDRIQLTLFLATKHMIDFDSTHCVPLPAQEFRTPWNLTLDD